MPPRPSPHVGRLGHQAGRGPALLVWAVEGAHDWAVLALDGCLDARCEGVLRAAWAAFTGPRRARLAIDLSGIRRWDGPGLARLIEVAADGDEVTVYGAAPRLSRALARTDLGWTAIPERRPHAPPRRWRLDVMAWADRAVALLALVMLSPLFGLIALAIRLDSPGPALFRQARAGQVGPDGVVRVFELLKFRTMVEGADALRFALREAATPSGPFFKLKGDPRVTRVGRFLRTWSLDELPQLLNVVRGEMRLVGNRPLPLDEAARLTEPWQQARFRAPAGITGLWQVWARSECAPRARLALDTAYAAARDPWLDVRILLATVPAVIRRKGW